MNTSISTNENDYEYKFCDLELGNSKSSKQGLLGKRKFEEAFHIDVYDDLRYGQHIGKNYFESNHGSNYINWEALEEGEIYEPEKIKHATNVDKPLDVEEILTWCEYYLSNRNLFRI